MIGLAYQRPDDIKQAITANNNGTYTVDLRILGRSKKYIITNANENHGGSFTDKNGIWPKLYELAVIERNGRSWLFEGKGPGMGDGIPLLTGHDFTFNSNLLFGLGTLANSLQSKLERGTDGKKIMILGTGTKDIKIDGLKAGHVYTVLKYDKEKDRVYLRDPHGGTNDVPQNRTKTGLGSGPGEFYLTLQECDDAFQGLAIED
jgi:hypothetical protein